MELIAATEGFAALSQPARLEVLRLLARAGPKGLAAGEMALGLGLKANTLSANLTVLLNAGLVRNRREGRSVRYFVQMAGLGALIAYLAHEVCGGDPATLCPDIDAQSIRS